MMGVEVTHCFATELDPGKLRGTVVIVPVANPVHAAWRAGLERYDDLVSRRRRRTLQRINTNRVWPGRAKGNLIEKIAHALYENICRQVDAIVDLHCCRICDDYFVAALDGHAGSVALAKAFGAPLVDLQSEKSYAKGLLFLVAPPLIDTPSILVEMSPDGDIPRGMLANGVRGVTNLLKHMRMLPGRPELPRTQVVVCRADPVRIFRAKREGYLTTHREVGEPVEKGGLLCEVRDLDRFRPVQTVRAPYDGTPPSIGPDSGLRLVRVGEEICTFKRVKEVVRN
jgi:predicted deacylase